MFNISLTNILRWAFLLVVVLFFGTAAAGCSFTLKDSGEFSIGYTSALVFKHHTAKTDAESRWGLDLAHSKDFIEGVHEVFTKPEGEAPDGDE